VPQAPAVPAVLAAPVVPQECKTEVEPAGPQGCRTEVEPAAPVVRQALGTRAVPIAVAEREVPPSAHAICQHRKKEVNRGSEEPGEMSRRWTQRILIWGRIAKTKQHQKEREKKRTLKR
jgi:hypothetical protein